MCISVAESLPDAESAFVGGCHLCQGIVRSLGIHAGRGVFMMPVPCRNTICHVFVVSVSPIVPICSRYSWEDANCKRGMFQMIYLVAPWRRCACITTLLQSLDVRELVFDASHMQHFGSNLVTGLGCPIVDSKCKYFFADFFQFAVFLCAICCVCQARCHFCCCADLKYICGSPRLR